MRLPTAFLAFALCCAAFAQQGSGVYKSGTNSASWSINENHALIWDGVPYLPYGLRVSGRSESILAAAAMGVSDVIVELPANGVGWKEAIATIEQRKMRYLIAIDSLAPAAQGYIVEPQSYRIDGILERRTIELDLPGARSALAVLALKRDGSVSFSKRVPVANGKLRIDLPVQNGMEHVLLLYPEGLSIALTDSWEAMDDHRDTLLRALKTTPLGPNLRGIVNPTGNMIQQSTSRLFVPKSPRFQAEFADFLEAKYRNVETVQRAWSMAISDASTFLHLARLVPLWSGARGVSQLWDPVTDTLIPCEGKRSLIWQDIQTVIATSEARRFKRLVSAIRGVCNVPILQEWAGWLPSYEALTPEIDGLAARTEGSSFAALAEGAGRSASSLLRWLRPGWHIASRIHLDGEDGNGSISAIADDLNSLAVRGQFFKTDSSNVRSQIGQEAARRNGDSALAMATPGRIFFPENALNPANVQKLPGNMLWLPTPDDGNRLDFGPSFQGYRSSSQSGQSFAIWSASGMQRVRLLASNPQKLQFHSPWVDPQPHISKGKLEVTLSDLPLIITGTNEIPIPQPAVDGLVARLALVEQEAERRRIDLTEELYNFRNAFRSLDRNPGGSYSEMLASFTKANTKIARFIWVEAESYRDSTFSETLTTSGCSGGAALYLRTVFDANPSDTFADYSVLTKGSEELEVWVAARIPKESRGDVNVVIGSQLLKISGEPISHYANGFGWYKVGTTRMSGNQAKFQLRVFAKSGIDLAVDAIVFFPGQFTPRGIFQPDAVQAPSK